MPTAKKVEKVGQLKDLLNRSDLAIVTEYRGASVSQMSDLRKRLREAGAEFHVAKNTLAKLAAQQVGRESMVAMLEGPTAIAFAMGDPSAAAKAITEFLRASRLPIKIKGAVAGNRFLAPPAVDALATLPPRQVMLASVLGTMLSPMTGLVTVLGGGLRGLMVVLQQRAHQLEEGAGPAPSA